VTAALEVRGLSAGYGPMRVLHNVDLALAPGERVGLLGLNGHGKTTLMRAVVGLVGWRRGDVRVRGRSVVGVPTFRLAREGVVMIPQGDALFPGLTVRENLDSGAYARGSWRGRRARRELVLDLFPRLAERLGQPVGTLSGGERRMVSVGRGLMTEADVYLVDEPSLGLAPGLAAGLVETLLTADLHGGAMLIAEQNRALIEERVDRAVTMHGGQLAEREPAGV
jgi:branched-chain amino acid transport system ATP-binding protein